MVFIAIHIGILSFIGAIAEIGCNIPTDDYSRWAHSIDTTSFLQAWVVGYGNATEEHTKTAQHVVTYYWDNECLNIMGQRELFEVSSVSGCYNIMEGEFNGSSFLLHCPKHSKQVRQTIYAKLNCKGMVHKRKKMQMNFVVGECENRKRIFPPVGLVESSGCKDRIGANDILQVGRDLGQAELANFGLAQNAINNTAEMSNVEKAEDTQGNSSQQRTNSTEKAPEIELMHFEWAKEPDIQKETAGAPFETAGPSEKPPAALESTTESPKHNVSSL